MNKGKEVATKAAARIFQAIAELMDAASIFYEAGHYDEGEATLGSAMKMIGDLPKLDQ